MIKRINKNQVFFVLTFFLLLVSCRSKVVFTDSRPMEGEIWHLMDLRTFKVNISDTVNSNNVMFTIRSGPQYPFRNIYLFVSAVSPDGKQITDTLQYNLADEKGKWYGKGLGDIHELNLPYKSNIYFPRKGLYVFKVRHGMRTQDLKGIYDFGLRIEKINK